jgi:response regulator RpfG family c-di-GMP phosphodiesterase
MGSWIAGSLEELGNLFQDEFSSYAYVFILLMGFAFVFLVLNPLAPKPAPRKPLEQPPEPPPARNDTPRILVVDDSNVVRVRLRRLLEAEGYEVVVTENGLLAEALLQKEPFALLITDLEMPEMNGFELIASVHGSRATENLPIIAITGHEELQARVHACEGIYGLFRKPWNDRELLRRVAALVHLGSALHVEETDRALTL